MSSSRERIIIHDLELFGRHGTSAAERERGGLFSLDLELEGEFGNGDGLEATVDYSRVIAGVEEVNKRSFKLIEAFARAVAEAILKEFPRVKWLKVRVKKLHPPLPPGTAVGWVAAEVIAER
ncbi:MAG: dihydroneopterin aldolase [Candidatus Bipolaricaulia bacterium]